MAPGKMFIHNKKKGGRVMADIKNRYGELVYRIEGDRIVDKYGDWKYTISGDRIINTYGEWKYNISGDYLYDTSGNRLGELRDLADLL
jgi:hypothetical protein